MRAWPVMTDPPAAEARGRAAPREGARCAAHPEREATDTCVRCGAFICAFDRVELFDRPYCGACGVHSDAAAMAAFQAYAWGRRDVWAWLILVECLLLAIEGGTIVLAAGPGTPGSTLVRGVLLLGFTVLGGVYFFGEPWGRYVIFLQPLSLAAAGLATKEPVAVWLAAFPFGAFLIALRDPRNQLFFRQEVPPARLEYAWRVHTSNRLALWGFFLGLFSILVPFLALLSLPQSILALTRVRADVRPRVGRVGFAIAGIVFSTFGFGLWIVLPMVMSLLLE